MAGKEMTAQDVIAHIKDRGIKMVDLKFVDVPGTWQHATIPASQVDEKTFKRGIGFDGSSIRGFQTIEESDMILMPDPASARPDPFAEIPTLSMVCNVYDPTTGKPYTRDPRHVAQKAEDYLRQSGIADTSYWGPEAEFFVFSNVQYDVLPYRMGYSIDSPEGVWNTGQPGQGYRIRSKEGYFPVPPADTLLDIRSEMALQMEAWGVEVEMQHHEVASAGQCEIDMKYSTLARMADNLMSYKYIVKNIARRHGMTATFMPKPLFGDNGNGMHTHQSLWKGGANLFYNEGGYAELSDEALHYVGGLLTHVNALLGLCACTTNSYRRLVPHFEAPVNIAFSKRNRSAAIRIPMYFTGPAAAASKRIEFRCPDATCNPYLAFAAMLMAGLDGIKHKIDPIKAGFGPLDKNTYELPAEEAAKVKSVPGSLDASLAALEADHEFLLEGDVFTRDLLDTWIDYKRTRELQEVNIRPVPYEFYLYYDI
ncbi:MAG TPA: type I glutamate--ammonia ligase [bacterium]|nr:type I glutamate--ammonia ligase [bacterium]